MEESSSAVKKTTRARKAVSQTASTEQDLQPINTMVTQDFDGLLDKIVKSRQEFDNLQKEIAQIKADWAKEQKQHEMELSQQKAQEELERKRERETYEYTISLTRKRTEDEFQDKKLAWEKDLAQRKQELEDQKQELDKLRKLVADFDEQKDQAVKEAQTLLEKELTERHENEKKLREQEIKSEKEIMGIKISNLDVENSRLIKEIEVLKRSLDEATRQVKEIAVKVIESGQPKSQMPSEA